MGRKMGQEVKNLFRAQSKYGLMGSSAKNRKKNFCGSQEQFLDKIVIWDRTPPSYTSTAVYMCGEGSRVPNLQTEFNYLNLFKSYGIFSDFVVPTWSPWSLHRPCHPYIIPIVPTSSLLSPCHPHSPQKVPIAPRRSHGLWSPWSPYVVSTCFPRHSHHPHVVSVIPASFRRSPHHPQPPDTPHPPRTPWGAQISKNAIEFELIKIFNSV